MDFNFTHAIIGLLAGYWIYQGREVWRNRHAGPRMIQHLMVKFETKQRLDLIRASAREVRRGKIARGEGLWFDDEALNAWRRAEDGEVARLMLLHDLDRGVELVAADIARVNAGGAWLTPTEAFDMTR